MPRDGQLDVRCRAHLLPSLRIRSNGDEQQYCLTSSCEQHKLSSRSELAQRRSSSGVEATMLEVRKGSERRRRSKRSAGRERSDLFSDEPSARGARLSAGSCPHRAPVRNLQAEPCAQRKRVRQSALRAPVGGTVRACARRSEAGKAPFYASFGQVGLSARTNARNRPFARPRRGLGRRTGSSTSAGQEVDLLELAASYRAEAERESWCRASASRESSTESAIASQSRARSIDPCASKIERCALRRRKLESETLQRGEPRGVGLRCFSDRRAATSPLLRAQLGQQAGPSSAGCRGHTRSAQLDGTVLPPSSRSIRHARA